MENNNKPRQSFNKTVYAGFTALIAAFLLVIIFVNNGHLTFVLDDPFIHLAVAENILQGHYGVNIQEPSSAASSIIWPYLLAPFTVFEWSEYAPLFLNLVFALLSIRAIEAVLSSPSLVCAFDSKQRQFFLWAFVLLANLISLVFVGMEHALQLWLSVLIILGLINFIERKEVKVWVYAAIVAAPIVRYECLAITVPAIVFLFFHGFRRQAVITAVISLATLLGFSWYLKSIGLDYLPSSILLKSNNEASQLASMLRRLSEHLATPKFYIMLVMFGVFSKFAVNKKQSDQKRSFALLAAAAIILFLLFGRFGWYFRYEIFIWVSLWLMAVYLFADEAALYLQQPMAIKKKLIAVLFILFVGFEHIVVTLVIPMAANNIYLQQYQMGRFVKEYYKKPVAVNDIGSITFGNTEYVLDLWGLASKEALDLRKAEVNAQWMQDLSEKHDVDLAMLYYSNTGKANGWFEQVPDNWIKLGELKMTAMGISVSKREVAFFALNEQAQEALLPLLKKFSETLPRLSHFEFTED